MVVLDVGELRHVSSTALKQVDAYEGKLSGARCGLVLTGVGPEPRAILARTGLLERIGEANILPRDPHLGGALQAGQRCGQALSSELRAGSADEAV